jgi:hypothetical protein
VEGTLLGLGEEAVGTEAVQHETYVALVLVERAAEDEDVVEIHDGKVVQEVAEHVIHQVLKRGRRIGQPEWHHPIFVVAIAGTESSLPFFSFGDAYEVVS